MSTWTNEKHANAKAWVADPVLGSSTMRQLDKGKSLLGDALGEIKRLQARPTITDEMVERAVVAQVNHHAACVGRAPVERSRDMPGTTDDHKDEAAGMRAALIAALSEGHQQ